VAKYKFIRPADIIAYETKQGLFEGTKAWDTALVRPADKPTKPETHIPNLEVGGCTVTRDMSKIEESLSRGQPSKTREFPTTSP
jgi:hypothetical protein